MRRRICENGPCKEVAAKPAPANPDLRRRICKDGPCVECPPGQTAGKDGKCSGTPAPTQALANQCQPGETLNGSACIANSNQCPAGEFWDGIRCISRTGTDDCANTNARAAALAHEVRAAKMDMEPACSSNPSGQQCSSLKQSYDFALNRYRMLMNEAPLNCRSMLPDPLSL